MAKPSLADVSIDAMDPDADADVDAGPETEGYEAAVSELADVLGIPDDKMGAFRDAFEAAVMNCR
jgi:hypothetical protein